ncbi:MAG: hypothetical protein B6U78_00700 [Candidatus Aenigmarchaeota archaeon ex4484_224]|nr:MAG: hypothetical protein B6U78_00700 [Candidatus Aenigmarchaeota archaeon ex4484_224]
MKIFQKEIKIKTKGIYDFVKITEKLEEVVKESKIKNGILFANSLHNTAALLIQEDDPTIFEDLKEMFERILPMNSKYHHSYEGNENATAHQKNNLLKSFFTVPIKDGKLVKGTWQDFWVIELFEPRERKVFVTIIGE